MKFTNLVIFIVHRFELTHGMYYLM